MAPIQVTWLGHAAFLINDEETHFLIDPWLGNPKAPADAKDKASKAKAILVSHGHFDHVGDTVALAKQTGAKVFCVHEVSVYLKGQGVPEDQIVGMNKGGTVDLGGGFKATMVHAIHSGDCGMEHPMAPGGDAAGWVVSCPNGHVIYHSGDTDVFGDMGIISDLYKPDVALMCIGGHYTMSPMGAAYAINKLMPSLRTVIPMHFGTFPLLAGNPADLNRLVNRKNVIVAKMEPGESTELSGRSVHGLLDQL
eukprot:Clim_evm6s249 gene=Clim_evmTU6s249